jgi:hypothetical protein
MLALLLSLFFMELQAYSGSTLDLRVLVGVGTPQKYINRNGLLETENPHCLKVGDTIHLCNELGACPGELLSGVCLAVQSTPTPNQLTVTPNVTANGGWITRAANLKGFRLCLTIGEVVSPALVGVGAICQGSEQLLIKGEANCVQVGDQVSLGTAFSPTATVKGKFSDCEYTVLVVSPPASKAVAQTEGRYVELKGQAPLIVYGSSPQCGMAVIQLSPQQTSSYRGRTVLPYKLELQYGWDYSKMNKFYGCQRKPQKGWSTVVASGKINIY